MIISCNPLFKGEYTEESQTKCLLPMAIFWPNFGHSSPPSALSSWFGLFLPALPKSNLAQMAQMAQMAYLPTFGLVLHSIPSLSL